MPEIGDTDGRTLDGLRDRIDAIDAAMHRLLIERGTVIESLIRTKGTGRPGAAFRPAREADMMRRLVARHAGRLPLATVEHIWREIITTFTRMQAPFDVAIDGSWEPERMRDLARFTFGFSVELVAVSGAAAVVARVAEANDLGLVARQAAGAWWRGLVGPGAPRVMALLPFVEARASPADLPAVVISPPVADPTLPDIEVVRDEFARHLRPTAHVPGRGTHPQRLGFEHELISGSDRAAELHLVETEQHGHLPLVLELLAEQHACPYIAKYFNWYAPEWSDSERRHLNPDVSVRPKGVIEKCTFCHHRLQKARENARAEERDLREEDFQPACVEACPTAAITFGDLDNPNHKVAELKEDPRAMRLMEDLGTEPKVYYLARRE